MLIILLFLPFHGEKLSVVTSINPYYLIALAVGDTLINVYNLLPPSASPHTYSPTPSDILRLNDADLIIMNGLHLEHAIMHKIGDIKDRVISIGDSLYRGGQETGSINPHVWLSPDNMAFAVTLIENAMSKRDTLNADIYAQHAVTIRNSISKTDSLILLDIEERGTMPVITFHNSFMYFLNHYGFESAGVIEKVPGRDPTPRDMSDLKRIISEKHIKVLFTEPQLSPRPAEVLADEMELSLMELDPLGYEIDAESVCDIIQLNYNVLKFARDSID